MRMELEAAHDLALHVRLMARILLVMFYGEGNTVADPVLVLARMEADLSTKVDGCD